MSSNFEFNVGEYTYSAEKIPAKTQGKLLIRLAPLIGGLGVISGATFEADVGGLSGAIGPFAAALSQLTDENYEYILDETMSRVKRKLPSDTGWTPVWSTASTPMFDDMNVVQMMTIVSKVLQNSFADFLPALR